MIVGLFIAAMAYLQYQRILNVDWERVQAFSQNEINWVVNAITHLSNTIDASHSGTLSNVGIPLVSSVSAGFVLGLARGYVPQNVMQSAVRQQPLVTTTKYQMLKENTGTTTLLLYFLDNRRF